MKDQLVKVFKEKFGSEGDIRSYFAPGRVNLIGEHTDYNGGHVFPCALTIGTYAIVRKREDRNFRFYSTNFESLGVRPFPEMALETVVFETPSASATSAIVIFFFSSFPIKPLLSSKQLLPLNCAVTSCIACDPATMLLCPALMLLRILCATILLSSYFRKKAMTFLYIFQTIFLFLFTYALFR